MKLTLVLLITTFLQLQANVLAQNVTLKVRNANLLDVFEKIQGQTGYDFLYSADDITKAKPVTLNIVQAPVKLALEKCFIGQDLVYTISKTTVLIKKKPLNRISSWIKVSGKVVDAKNQPLPGVTIREKGTDLLSISDKDGNYSINASNLEATLVYSYLGFDSQEVAIGGRNIINITLKEKNTGLEQIVVVGYGTVNKKDLTGSVGQVEVKDLVKAPVASFDDALAGRVAGVQVSSAQGQPGNAPNIVIRGANSLTQSNSPLYVIDGFPIEDPTNAAINPQDIQSIDILKDASATAIYGSRGANGVIVIETKKGKAGKTAIAFNTSQGAQTVTKTLDLMNPYQFIQLQREVDQDLADSRYLTDRTLESYLNEPGYNWQKELFRTAPMHTYNLSLTGGNAQTKYALSGSIFNQDGVITNSGLDRYQGRISLDHNVNDKLSIGLNSNYSSIKNYGRIASDVGTSGSASSYLMFSIWGYRPIAGNGIDLLDNLTDSDIASNSDFRVNPLISTENELIAANNRNLTANAFASYKINKDLVLKVTGGMYSRILREESFFNSLTSRGTTLIPTNTRGVNGSIAYTETNTWVNENTLRYKKELKRHVFDLLGGITLQGTARNMSGFLAQQVPNETLGLSGLDEGTPLQNFSLRSDNKLLSFLGRANYNYRYKYYVTANFRADGSSKFYTGNRWGYFPSGSVAWRMDREEFMKKLPFVSDAKLRVSYGITGNNRIDDYAPYASLSFNPVYSPYQLTHYSFFNQTPGKGLVPSSLPNQDLKWETTSQVDIGYDLGLFNSRITLTADVYRKTTSDLLLNANMPYATGYNRAFLNIGKIQNQGLELTVNSVNVNGEAFKWNSNINISFNRNKVLALNGIERDIYTVLPWETLYSAAPLYKTSVDQPISQFFGYRWDGVYQYSDFDLINEAYVLKTGITKNGTTTVQPGDIKYRDLDGDLQITDADRTVIGNPLPKHTGGFSNNFSYKGFDLNVLFQWSYGNEIMNANRIILEGNALNYTSLNQFASYLDRWTPDNPSNTLARVGGQGPRGVYSSRTIEDGSFLRLKTISLGYNLPAGWVERMKLGAVNVSASAQNLATWTKYTGMDPEVSVRYSALTQGFDYSAYPRARTLTFDLKVTF
ncbi:TonB-dependent receptor [Desertivirga xinjiangensis]|uniref:TonB-dependent receptor n=1 Tax=Desertivirga xinjiangensis TaxID=539206 RepID=UPI00210C77DA|nr:TonB-dependent receptor [Pedobacter xinjiangensis]